MNTTYPGRADAGAGWHGRGSRVYQANNDLLEQVRLQRAVSQVTAISITVIGASAILMASAGLSIMPALCIGLALPAFGWGIRYMLRRPVSYVESIAYVTYCDVAILIGIWVVTSSGAAFVKLAWLLAANTYVSVLHGRLAVVVQTLVTAAGTALAVIGAVLRHDVSATVLTSVVFTMLLANVIAGWLIYLGKGQFAEHAVGRDHLSRHDHLTGLLNRRGLQEAYATWAGVPGMQVVVAVVDLNAFKSVNDTFGHHVGDEVLRRAAERLRAVAGPDALLARLGGDEFGIVALTDSPRELDYRTAVREALSGDDGLPVTASVGVAGVVLPESDRTVTHSLASVVPYLLVEADGAMYHAKKDAGIEQHPPR
ncbi:GGDEF domain-containing protein [Mycobacteroides immunogenum]|uniref:Diguanylate cyclase n=1 Tax=Mycobacteroides immunogenum TaxID=83262 RepID=A0A7V8LL22_9MYCO|nr:sensor domain-containing diguanylate cyclase [Mycobacteroides immunogenum]AMT70572.1 diguanylate cyclase [Mycobacteroides immunogenum]ANO03658.1 diguanylate cyclase [Mycobacteroides immunogenum]KIU38057.1 diguanylate cyclase [Mycobacteroides immunogenum]KPG04524.1 diguanylate cyclase [Mycobacteroides immunogenum]KPG05339.1 diguanylate cyclase [Mycobacteroides immunogenum]